MSDRIKKPCQLIDEKDDQNGHIRGIEYGGWKITSKKTSICNSIEMDSLQKTLALPLPEMVFGNNYICIEKDGKKLQLEAIGALEQVERRETIKVAYAAEWARKNAASHTKVKEVIAPYDWTYSTGYTGTCTPPDMFEPTNHAIDVETLKRQDPILFYDENVLYEDELADNGTAVLSVRLRVMPTCFLVLQRFFLRVDDVLFRINDTRFYHAFGSPWLIREYTAREDSYANVTRHRLAQGKGDLSILNDTNWVASILPEPTVLHREQWRVT